MFITSTKSALPGRPFGYINGNIPSVEGIVAVADYGFKHDDVAIPAGTVISVVEVTKRWVRYELKLPELTTIQ